MSLALYKSLKTAVEQRRDETMIGEANMMAALYEGNLPPEYDKFFPSTQPKHIVQLVRDAWDDLASQVGKFPDLHVEPLKETAKEANLAEKLERISYAYLDKAEPSGRLMMRQVAWWLVGTGRACVYVRPDYKKMTPVLTIKDHRTAFPNMRTVGNVPVEIFDIIFAYDIPYLEAVALDLAPTLDPDKLPTTKRVEVLEFIDDQRHAVVSEYGKGTVSTHGLGYVPAWVFQNFNPNRPSGISLFKNQVSLMVAVSMLVSLKLAAADRTVNPIYWAKGWQGSVKIGPSVLNKLGPQGEIGRIDPPRLDQTDRDIAQLVQFSNILNKHPEVRQGQVDSKGAYLSSKTLETLASSLDTVVGDYWDNIALGMRHLIRCCYAMDETLWPYEEKRISLNIKGNPVRDKYTPIVDIDGRYEIAVNYGFGIGGYQGFLQNIQANQAKMKSRKAAMQEMPGVTDVPKDLRQMQLEDLDDAGMALIQTQATSGQMDMLTWAQIRKSIAETGKELHEVIGDLQAELQEQAAAAMTGGGAEAMTAAPAPPGSMEGPDLRALPGLNPGSLVG